jgi:hypothetical protein
VSSRKHIRSDATSEGRPARSDAKRASDLKYYASEKGQQARQRKLWRKRGLTVEHSRRVARAIEIEGRLRAWADALDQQMAA